MIPVVVAVVVLRAPRTFLAVVSPRTAWTDALLTVLAVVAPLTVLAVVAPPISWTDAPLIAWAVSPAWTNASISSIVVLHPPRTMQCDEKGEEGFVVSVVSPLSMNQPSRNQKTTNSPSCVSCAFVSCPLSPCRPPPFSCCCSCASLCWTCRFGRKTSSSSSTPFSFSSSSPSPSHHSRTNPNPSHPKNPTMNYHSHY